MKTDTDSSYMSAMAAKRFQSKLDSLKRESNWTGMIKMLKRYAVRYPNEYYISQQLAEPPQKYTLISERTISLY